MDLKKAYEILGVSKDTPFEEIEERFIILVKRVNAARKAGAEQGQFDQDELYEAYNVVKSHQEDENDEEFGLKKKLDHFFHYYRLHMVGGVIAIIVVWTFISFMLDKQDEQRRLAELGPVDLNVMLVGDFRTPDLSPLKEKMTTTFPEWNNMEIDLIFFGNDASAGQDYGSLMKNQAILFAAKPDLLIMDQYQYDIYVKTDSFLPLDVEPYNLAEKVDTNRLLYDQTEKENTDRLYGIKITGSEIFNESNISGDKIAVIPTNTNNIENAMEFITKAVESADDK